MPELPPPERQARYRWAERLVEGRRVLDAGCGAGYGTAALARSAEVAVGVDFAPAAIETARSEHGEVADFREGDLRSLPFGDGEFDTVVCFEAISQVLDVDMTLDELRRVLRPGGMLLISSPNRGVYPAGNPLHVHELSSDELARKLTARFERVAVYRQQAYFASLLGTEATLAHDDPTVPIEVESTKLLGGPPGSELHAVAVATDGELPPEPAHLALGEQVDYEEQQRQLAAWRERAVEAEAEVLALRRQLRSLRR